MIKFETRIDMIKSLITPMMVGAELGVLSGEFSEEIIKTNPLRLHLVDVWSGRTPCANADGNDLRVWDLDECYKNLQTKYKEVPSVKLHRCTSIEFLNNLPNEYLDFVYIDTTHTFDDTLNEINCSWPKLKPGGYLMGHDFDLTIKCQVQYNFEVDRAVYTFCSKNNRKIHALAYDGCMSFAIKK